MAWGDTLADVALNQSLADGVVFLNTVKCVYVVSSYLNYTFAMFPYFSIVESVIFARWNKSEPSVSRKWAKNSFRTCSTIICAILAFSCASFLQALVSLLGVICSVPLALWLPGFIHL